MKKSLFLSLILFPFLSWSQEVVFPTLPAWKKEGKPLNFNKENLYEHIDGASEFYLSYGFESLQVASWNKDGAELTIEVYDHGDPLHAYGIYSIEKSAKAETSAVGLEGYGDAATYNFVAGKYYVKMNGTALEKAAGFSLKSVAAEFASTLCAKPEYPKVVGLFPKENQVSNSCQYIPTEFMGLGFLGSAVRAKYNLNGTEITLFIIERADRAEVEKMVLKYISYAEAKIKKAAEGDLLLKDPFNGSVFLRWKGSYLIGATGFSDKKIVVSLLDQISGKL
jgi:subtilisin family serine protease